MNIHEYQAKAILRAHGVPVPAGGRTTTVRDARSIIRELGGKVVVKAQVHAGGRGKGRVVSTAGNTAEMYERLEADPANVEGAVVGPRRGGVRLVEGIENALEEYRALANHFLVTHQTGPAGAKISSVLIEEQTDIASEFYAAVLIDGSIGKPVVVASTEGGQSIEEVAAQKPRAIVRQPVDPDVGFPAYRGRQLARRLRLPSSAIRPTGELFAGLYRTFVDTDATLVELNPFCLTAAGGIIAVDAKINIDDNASFRQPLEDLRDLSQEDKMEIEAEKAGIGSYIKLDGDIGCMVNGAGLAMATMDSIMLHGGEPANFLDIGTVNRSDRVVSALRIIQKDPAVKAILINIFGGLARVDIVAEGVVEAVKKLHITQPIIVRLNGSNVAEGRKILLESDITVESADELAEASRLAVAAASRQQ